MEQNREDPSLLVHLEKDECAELDTLQGGTEVIPVDDQFVEEMANLGFPIEEGQIRDYRPLGEMLKNPELRETIIGIVSELKRDLGPKKLNNLISKIDDEDGEEKFLDIPENNPKLKKLAKEGRYGDTEIVYMPLSLCDLLDEIRGETSTNPKTGFPEYGKSVKKFFKKSVKVLGAVGGLALGAMTGNPALAVAGLGLGRTAGGLATGEKPGDALKKGVQYAGTGTGFALAGPLGAGIGRTVGGLATGDDLKDSLMGGLRHGAVAYGAKSLMDPGGLFAGLGGSAASAPIYSGATGQLMNVPASQVGMLNAAGATAAGNAAAGAAGSAASGGIGSLLGNITGGGSSFLAPAALAALGVQQMNKGRKQELKAWEKENQRARNEENELRRKYGFYNELPGLEDIGDYNNDPFQYERDSFEYYKTGGKIRRNTHRDMSDFVTQSETFPGNGKGQADNINRDLPQKAYIVNATAVAHLGDGNSEAGKKVLQKFEKKLNHGYKGPKVNKKLGIVKAKVSSAEHQFSPLSVTILGNGNNSQGADKLDKAISKLMLEKTQNGSKLPPKAKRFEDYFR